MRICPQKKESKLEELHRTNQEGTKKHKGLLSLAEEIRRIMYGETLNEQSGIQNAFQKSAQLDMAVSVFLAFLCFATDLKAHSFLNDRSNRPLGILSEEETSPAF